MKVLRVGGQAGPYVLLFGLGLIVAGVVIVNLFSDSASH